LVRLDGNSR